MKVGHLTEDELRQYWKRGMSPASLLAADDHLAECADCRKSLSLMEKGSAGGASLFHALTGEEPAGSRHLTHDELVANAEETDSAAERQQVTEHLRLCSACREDVEDLRNFRREPATISATALPSKVRAKSRPFWTIPLWAGAAAAVLLAVFLGVRSYRSKNQAGPSALIQLNDDGGSIKLDSSGRVVTPAPLSREDAAQVKDALLHGRVETAAALSPLQSQQGTLLGESAPTSSLQVIAPIGTVVLSDKPGFRWRQVNGASGYVVSIYDSRFQKVAESSRVKQHEWVVDHSLSRGAVYTWQVTAFLKGKAIRAPAPPAPEARFQVLSQADAEQLEQTRRQHPNSHLLLGLLYAKVGALDDSERELKALLAANPGSSLANELLASVQQLRSRLSK